MEKTMRIEKSLGNCPTDEDCLQVGFAPYEKLLQETAVYAKQISEQFELPQGVFLHIMKNEHDFGSYPDLMISCDSHLEEAQKFVSGVEKPQKWTAKSLAMLKNTGILDLIKKRRQDRKKTRSEEFTNIPEGLPYII